MTASEMKNAPVASHVFYPLVFNFERNFNVEGWKNFLDQNVHYVLLVCVLYFFVIVAGVRLMRDRPSVNLKWTLAVWNTALALMSFLGVFRLLTELVHTLVHHGFESSVCDVSGSQDDPVFVSSVTIFALSKVVELFDTLFLVLRKKKLTTLHWFHHSSVMVLVFYSLKDRVAVARWYGAMNYLVHSLMYSYYTLRVLGVRVPKRCGMTLTSMQILQMVVGSVVSTSASIKWLAGKDCSLSARVILLGISLYLVYLFLFLKFFKDLYLRKAENKKKS